MAVETAAIVERIWSRDSGLWTGADEDRWLGWLAEPLRLASRVADLEAFARKAYEDGLTEVVLAGMGGSSLAPEVMRRTFSAESFHVLDTTHPDAIRALEASVDLEHTLFLVASKSGTTLETRCHLAYFWEKTGGRGRAVRRDHGPGLGARAPGGRARLPGRRGLAFRRSAGGTRRSPSSGWFRRPSWTSTSNASWNGRTRWSRRAGSPTGIPAWSSASASAGGWREGRDKVQVNPSPGGFGLWVEQLLAESTGKEGKGLVPVPGETSDAPDRQSEEVRIADPYELGQEFYRWEFATAVAGALMGINPFDQPNVQEAKDRTRAILDSGEEPGLEPVGTLDELLAQAGEGDYFCVQAFVEPTDEAERTIEALRERVRAETGIATTAGFGPRYLHSTGQLHKGGPASGLFLQVVDDPEELPIPGRDFGFRRLIRAQAAGDFEALRERGRRTARVRWEDIA